jgi:hypothetical protein
VFTAVFRLAASDHTDIARLLIQKGADGGQGAVVVHDPTAELFLTALGDVDLLLDRPDQPFFGRHLRQAGD